MDLKQKRVASVHHNRERAGDGIVIRPVNTEPPNKLLNVVIPRRPLQSFSHDAPVHM
jgi:hypothetical protein